MVKFPAISALAAAVALLSASAQAAESINLEDRIAALESQLDGMKSAAGMTTEQKKGTPMKISGNARFGYNWAVGGDSIRNDIAESKEKLGEFGFENARLKLVGQHESGLDYTTEFRLDDSESSSMLSKAFIGYGFDNGSYLTVGKFAWPYGAEATEYSYGTNDYVGATWLVTDSSDYLGAKLDTPISDALKLTLAFAPHAPGQGDEGTPGGYDQNNQGLARLTYGVADGQDIMLTGALGQIVSYRTIFNSNGSGDDTNDYDSGTFKALALSYVGAFDCIETVIETSIYDIDTAFPDYLVTPPHGAGRELINGYIVSQAAVTSGHVAYTFGDDDGWVKGMNTYLEGNMQYGFDVNEEAWGALVGVSYSVADHVILAHELATIKDTGGWAKDVDNVETFYTHFRYVF